MEQIGGRMMRKSLGGNVSLCLRPPPAAEHQLRIKIPNLTHKFRKGNKYKHK